MIRQSKGFRGGKAKAGVFAEINIVPYIDVMLVLLVIFMVTAPLLQQGVNVDLPKAVSRPLDNHEKDPIIVSVDATGKYYINIAKQPDKSIDQKKLVLLIRQEIKQDASRKILVKGDRRVNYDVVIKAMVLLQQAGASSVGLMTDAPEARKG